MKSRLYVSSGVILALVLAYGAASWYTGKLAELRIEQAVEQANQQLAATWPPGEQRPTLQVQTYQRGVFSSDVEYAFAFKDDAGRDQMLRVHDDLQHGPFPWRAVSAGEWSPLIAYSRARLLPTEALQVWFDSQQGASPLQIDTRVSFGGKARSLWQFRPAKFMRDDDRIDFSGGLIEVDFDHRLKTSQTSGQFESLVWENTVTGERGEFKTMTFDGHNAFASDEDIQIHNQAHIAEIKVTQDRQPVLTLADMQIKLDSSRTGGLLDSALGYEFGSIRVGEADLGRLQAGMRIEHVDVEAFKALARAWEQANPGNAGDEELSAEAQALLKEKIQGMLASSPSVAIDPLKWRNAQGESQALLAIHFMPAQGEVAPDEDMGALLERSLKEVKLSLSISKPMLVQVFGQMGGSADADTTQALASMLFDHYTAGMQRAGLVEVKDGVASLNVSYQAGEVVLGGAKMSVAAFIALIRSVMG